MPRKANYGYGYDDEDDYEDYDEDYEYEEEDDGEVTAHEEKHGKYCFFWPLLV